MDLRSAPAGTAPVAALDDRTRKLLLKLRKGADASLSFPQLFKVLGLLGGWTVEEIVGLTPFHYEYGGKPVLADVCVAGEAEARRVYDLFAARVVAGLPQEPVMGESYVMALGAFGPVAHYKGDHHGARFQLWVGTPGYRITAPTGEQFEVVPSRHDFQDQLRELTALPTVDPKALKRRLRHWDAMKWLKGETSYLAQVSALLGMEEHVPAAQRTRDNTGTCPCCFRNIKLDREHPLPPNREGHPTMALHGYQRPGDGDIRGRCASTAWFAPYELSAEGTAHEREGAKARLDVRRATLAQLQDPEIVEFTEYRFMREPLVHRKGDADWTRQLGHAIESARHAVETAEVEHATFAWLVDHWEPRALPTAGSKEPDYWTPAVSAVLASRKETA